MLVLSRKVGQTISVGDDIVITLCYSTSGRARIGIEAPKNLKVIRTELDRHDTPPAEAKPAEANRRRHRLNAPQAKGIGSAAQLDSAQ